MRMKELICKARSTGKSHLGQQRAPTMQIVHPLDVEYPTPCVLLSIPPRRLRRYRLDDKDKALRLVVLLPVGGAARCWHEIQAQTGFSTLDTRLAEYINIKSRVSEA